MLWLAWWNGPHFPWNFLGNENYFRCYRLCLFWYYPHQMTTNLTRFPSSNASDIGGDFTCLPWDVQAMFEPFPAAMPLILEAILHPYHSNFRAFFEPVHERILAGWKGFFYAMPPISEAFFRGVSLEFPGHFYFFTATGHFQAFLQLISREISRRSSTNTSENTKSGALH